MERVRINSADGQSKIIIRTEQAERYLAYDLHQRVRQRGVVFGVALFVEDDSLAEEYGNAADRDEGNLRDRIEDLTSAASLRTRRRENRK